MFVAITGQRWQALCFVAGRANQWIGNLLFLLSSHPERREGFFVLGVFESHRMGLIILIVAIPLLVGAFPTGDYGFGRR